MKAHLQTQSGDHKTIECEAVWESESGLYLMERPSQKLKHAVGYVPFERLDYVDSTDDE